MADRPDDEVAFTLVIETKAGVVIRRVLPASSLPPGPHDGHLVEDVTKSAAAFWGMPDFVFDAPMIQKGNAQREVGDGLLICGQNAAVVQVKSRAAASGDAGREARWIEKTVDKALRQADGSLRSMASGPLELRNHRGNTLSIDPGTLSWISVVIVDHPDPPEVHIAVPSAEQRGRVVLIRRDWEFLWGQLRSTHAVLSYLGRVALEADVLGGEVLRYYDLAQEDEVAPPGELDPALGDGRRWTEPLLPMAPAGHESTNDHLVVRAVMEDVAVADGLSASQRQVVLSEIDQLLIAQRSALGSHLLAQLDAMREMAPLDGVSVKARYIRRNLPAPQLVFVTMSRHSPTIETGFQYLITLRHHEFGLQVGRLSELVTVGILITPRSDGLRPWDTAMVRIEGDPGLTAEDVGTLQRAFGPASEMVQ